MAGVTNQSETAANQLNKPFGLEFDYSNSLYISDLCNNRIQKYQTGDLFATTIAGQANGTGCMSSVCLSMPADVTVDTNGNIYVADTSNSRVQFWSSGSLSEITIAGNST